jgi:Flp pilus assembly protein TadD
MDAGELTAAAYTLGVAHPTGFPLFLLFGKGVSLAPLGEVALRLNLLSVLCGAGACLLAARLARRLVPPTGLATGLLAAVLTAGGATFWSQATVAEVYAPTILVLLLLLVLASVFLGHAEPRPLFLLAFVSGLAVGLHATLWIAIGVLVPALLLDRRARALLVRHLGVALAAFVLGLAVQIYLPLSSLRDPAVDWGNPETWSAFWDHFTAGRIRRAFSEEIGVVDWLRWSHHLGVYLERLTEGIPPPGLLLLPIGAWISLRSSRPLGLTLVVLLALDVAFATLVNPMGLEDRQAGLPGQVVAALLAAVALGQVAALGLTRWRRGQKSPGSLLVAAALAAALALGVAAVLESPQAKLRQGDHAPGEIVDATLEEIPAGAVLFTQSDDLCAGTIFARTVESARPDILHIVRQHVWDRTYLEAAAAPILTPSSSAGTPQERIARQEEILRELVTEARAQGRPVVWEGASDDRVAGVPLFPAGLLAQTEPVALVRRASLSMLLAASDRLTPGTRRHAAGILDRQARALILDERGLPLAIRTLQEALRLCPEASSSWNNLAVVLARAGRLREAIQAAREAARLAPLKANHWANLGLFLLRQGEDAGSRDAYARARALDARDPRPWVGLGILAARSGHKEEARRLLREGLARGAEGDTRTDALVNLRLLGETGR